MIATPCQDLGDDGLLADKALGDVLDPSPAATAIVAAAARTRSRSSAAKAG
jgi:hypothetical protein